MNMHDAELFAAEVIYSIASFSIHINIEYITSGPKQYAQGFAYGFGFFGLVYEPTIYVNLCHVDSYKELKTVLLHEYRHLLQMKHLRKRFGLHMGNRIFNEARGIMEDDAYRFETGRNSSLCHVLTAARYQTFGC